MTTVFRHHPHIHNTNNPSTSVQHMANFHDSDSPTPVALDTPSPGATDGSGTMNFHGVGTAEGKRIRERRVMPARLQRVSSLLAGSIIEEEIAGAAAKEEANSGLPGSTTVVITTRDDIPVESVHPINSDEKTINLQNRELIETPEFRLRDDMEVMGKTRSMRSDEDTSDAAYERRHRKADNAEKRLRRWEKENLKKDRQKIVERIDRLKAADTRMLAPILSAREDRQRLATGGGNGDSNGSNGDATGASGSNGISIDPTVHQTKLEHLREELIEEHRVMLQRYDALLTVPTEETPSEKVIGKRKKVHDDDGNTSTADEAEATNKSSRTSNKRSISVSGAFARKSNGPDTASANLPKSSSTLRASASTSSLLHTSSNDKKPNTKYIARDIKARKFSMEERTPKPFTEEDGKVRAEHTYANIHARTSGGRFAPKNALASVAGSGPIGSTSKINSKMGRVKSGSQQQRKSSTTKKTTPSKVAKKESSVDNSTSSPVTPSRSARARGKPSRSPTTVSELSGNASATQSPGDSSRTRRVRLILRNNKNGDTIGSDDLNSADIDSSKIKQEGGSVKMDVDLDSENELDSILPASRTPARAALTIEEAQALLAKAMADGEDDDQDDERDAADAAASLSTK